MAKPLTYKQKLVVECEKLGLETKGLTVEQLEAARDEKIVADAEEQAEAQKAADAQKNAPADAEPQPAALSRSGNYVTQCNLRRGDNLIGPGEDVKLTRSEAACYIRQGAVKPA